MVFPNINDKFILECDSSKDALGYVLRQKHGIIVIRSRKYTKTELNYSIVEKEFLVIKEALQDCKKIILGCPIIVNTDNESLLNYKSISGNRIDRCKWIVEEFNVTMEHIVSSANPIADELSREFTEKNSAENKERISNDLSTAKI